MLFRSLLALGRRDDAVRSYDQAIALQTEFADAHYNRGVALQELGRLEEAIGCYERALAIRHEMPAAHVNRANALLALGLHQAALTGYDAAIALKPDFAQALSNRGVALQRLGRPEEAIASLERAIALDPRNPEAHANLGSVLHDLRRYRQAIASHDRALALAPDFVEALVNRGKAWQQLGQADEALACFDRVLALRPQHADALVDRASILKDLRLLEAAAGSYERALQVAPAYEYLSGTALLTRMRLCDWRGYDDAVASLVTRIGQGEKVAHPFTLLACCDSPAVQGKAAAIYVPVRFPPDPSLGPLVAARRAGHIRIGYYSADFRQHAVSSLVSELLEVHDRQRFEVVAFSFGPQGNDAMRRRIEADPASPRYLLTVWGVGYRFLDAEPRPI